jgi:DNA/RNA-binding domain of Phe-tRNA-synthetase-like protein
MGRSQLYGGREADEYRAPGALFNDHLADNEIAEGDEVRALRLLLQKAFSQPRNISANQAIQDYMDTLKTMGFSPSRINSIYMRASARLEIGTKPSSQQPSPRALRRQERKKIK